MAAHINKNRMALTRALVVAALILPLVSLPALPPDSFLWPATQLAGYVLLTACALGRIHATAFIGGVKNDRLMTAGPYAMCRNPLYFYSLLGAAGIGFLSAQITCLAVLLGGFLWIYRGLITREEAFLADKFGADFTAYAAAVPRLWPNPRRYTAPTDMPFQPKFLTHAVWDAVWWFAPLPWFQAVRMLQDAGALPMPKWFLY